MTPNKDRHDKKSDAVTFDWIVMTAAAIGLVIVAIASIRAGENGLASSLASYVIPTDT